MLGGKFNLMSLMKNAKKMQELMEQTKADLEKITTESEAGAGLVRVTVDGKHQIASLTIADELMKEPKAVIEELVMAAVNDANTKINRATQEKMMNAGSFLFDQAGEETDK